MPKLPARQAKIFKKGCNRAVRTTGEFELPGDDAIVREERLRLIIEPGLPRSFIALLQTLEPIAEDFGAIEELPTTELEL